MSPHTVPSPDDLHHDQVIALLRSRAHATLLSAYFGEAPYRELCQLAKLAATRRNPRGQLAFVLPGIMGSRLAAVRGKTFDLLWLHPTAIANGGLMQLTMPGSRAVRALGVMLPGYLKLRLSLEIAGFRPVFHPFDWRCDVERLGRALMQTIERSGTRRVVIVAHSMGGLVARCALAHDSKRRIAKLVQLGAPNAGSFAPLQALRAVYPTVRKITALDQKHSAEELAQRVFLTLPGLYQMLPSPQDAEHPDFFDARDWPRDGLMPDNRLLARARRVRARLCAADDRCFVIAGANQETIVSAMVDGDGLRYTIRADGDGTVPLSRALWDGARTWFVTENHGALVLNNRVLAAITDILRSADTARLRTQAPAASTAVRHVDDSQLRLDATRKVHWETLSLDSRRRILEPVISPEFNAPAS